MVTATTKAEPLDLLAGLTRSAARSTGSTGSFGRELATEMKDRVRQDSAGRQVVAAAAPAKSTAILTSTPAKVPSASTAEPSMETAASDIPTMPGTRPVQYVANPQPVAAAAPMSEGDAYWADQPTAVQALRYMPDGEAKNALALKLANQGYAIDTQIMVWGWDPQMTMTVRENQGYSWVPGYGQANIPVGPGLSMPDDPNTYNPGNAPAGAIQVSTAFAVGTIQNPLVQTADS
jgi:hypothetical protein